MSTKTVYLISGANRGIGYGLTSALAARPNTIVFAGARNPGAQSLTELAAKHPNVHPVKLTMADPVDNEAAIAHIQKTAGQLDVIIANVGVLQHIGPLVSTPLSQFQDHWEPRTSSSSRPPTGTPTLAFISSLAGSVGWPYFDMGQATYGATKAAANYFVKALDAEHPTLVALAIHPGWVATEPGNASAVRNGLERAPVDVEESVAGGFGAHRWGDEGEEQRAFLEL
ncbi:NAD(P)-binding protein [Mycena sanguinolenta]|uniref:NAD(P)-binding protein n=1 Tax=Mycena sanguinolenta TaxID=230812 RepID=A0A8H6XPX3_9AGAR|nr:NAD(P)-binding protein [Mycena sanguinolenta]